MACRWCRGDVAHWLTGRMSLITRIKSLTRPAASVREFRGQYLIPGILASGQIDRHIACGFLVIAHLLLSIVSLEFLEFKNFILPTQKNIAYV